MDAESTTSALRRLRQLGDDEAGVLDDPGLNRLLDPLRPEPPVPLKCGAGRCGETIAYWALSCHGARIVAGPKRRRRSDSLTGVHMVDQGVPDRAPREIVVAGESDLLFPGLAHTGRFPEYVEYAMSGRGTIRLLTNPDVGAPYPLRLLFHCPRCGFEKTYTNAKMLEFYLDALTFGQPQIMAS